MTVRSIGPGLVRACARAATAALERDTSDAALERQRVDAAVEILAAAVIRAARRAGVDPELLLQRLEPAIREIEEAVP